MRNWLKVIFLAAMLVTVIGCGDKKSTKVSTRPPSEMIVGHWATPAGDNLYFSALSADGIGSYILVQGNSGRTFKHRYKILDQSASSGSMLMQQLYVSGGSSDVKVVFASDGGEMTTTKEITGMQISSEHKLVDSKTEP